MKRVLLMVMAISLVLLAGCGSTAAPPVATPEPVAPQSTPEKPGEPSDPAIVQEAAIVTPQGSTCAPDSQIVEPFPILFSTTHKPGAASCELQRNMLKVFEEKAPGMFKFEMYDSAVLYNTDAELPAILSGDIDMSCIQPSFLYDNGVAWGNMLDMGYLNVSYDHMKAIYDLNGDIGKDLQQRLWDELHVMTFGAEYLGTRNIWLAKYKEIKTPEDLQGIKLRMPSSASYVMLGEGLGINPTPLDISEIYLAMETGTVDGHENLVLPTFTQGQVECAETLVKTEHMICPNFVTLNGDTWQKMTAKQQETFYTLMLECIEINDEQILVLEEETFKKCEDEFGVVFQYPDKQAFIDRVQSYYLSKPENQANWDMDLLDRINTLGKEYLKQ